MQSHQAPSPLLLPGVERRRLAPPGYPWGGPSALASGLPLGGLSRTPTNHNNHNNHNHHNNDHNNYNDNNHYHNNNQNNHKNNLRLARTEGAEVLLVGAPHWC